MAQDVCEALAAVEQVELLRAHGFGPLLDVLENDPSCFFPTTGYPVMTRIAAKLSVSDDTVLWMFRQARALLDGEISFEKPHDHRVVLESR